MKINRILITALSAVTLLFLVGCGVNQFDEFYKPNFSQESAKAVDYKFLVKGEEPRIITTTPETVKNDILRFKERGFAALGSASFKGDRLKAPDENIIEHAKKVGATTVLVMVTHEGVRSGTTTTMESRNINTSYLGTYGQGVGSAVSTYYVPKTTSYSYEQMNYVAHFLVKSTKKGKFGIGISNLTDELKKKFKRNTGVLILGVTDDSPAFYANLLRGDVILKIDGVEARSASEGSKIIEAISPNAKSSTLTIFRDGKEMDIVVKFND
jgi:membrane-associated protease RseP (regulator of RpoE activity)